MEDEYEYDDAFADDMEYDGQPDDLQENSDFAQDDDFHNMYPHEDGFCYND